MILERRFAMPRTNSKPAMTNEDVIRNSMNHVHETAGKLVKHKEDTDTQSGKLSSEIGEIHPLLNKEKGERKQTEEKLKKNGEYFRALVENSLDVVLLVNQDGSIRYVSPSCKQLFGYDEQEIVGKNIFDYIHPDNVSDAKSIFEKGIHVSGFVSHNEYRLRHKRGSWSYIEVFGKYAIENPAVNGVILNVRDITEHKVAENALKESQEFSSIILNNAPNPVVMTNADTSIKYVNPAFESLVGYTGAEVIGRKSPYPWWVEEKLDQYRNEDRIGRIKGLNIIERCHRKKNGEMFWVVVTIRAVKDGETVKYYLANWVDITEHKQMEDSLKESNEFNSSLLKYSPSPVMVINADASIRYANPAMEKLTGFSARELTGMKMPYPFWPKENIGETEQQLMKGFKKSIYDMEKYFLNKNGELFWANVNLIPIKQHGELKYLLSSWTDITEPKRLREELDHYMHEITRVQEEEKKRIARELHDDTAQSLAMLSLELDALVRSKELFSEKAVSKLQDLREEANRAMQDVRRFSHELRPGVLDRLGLTASLESLVEDMNEKWQIRADLQVLGTERRLSGENELALFRIAQETMNNIRKHSQATRASIRIRFLADKVRLLVTDNGKGFNLKEMREFAKAGKLGLIGMKERAHLAGADLKIRSRLNQGTVVSVLLLA
jgi:PAS domain S-box-containing protein